MTHDELAEKIARLLNPGEWWDKDPHPADRAMWMGRGHAIADALWPVLAQVWEEGYGDAYDDAHDLSRLHPTINPYGEVSA